LTLRSVRTQASRLADHHVRTSAQAQAVPNLTE